MEEVTVSLRLLLSVQEHQHGSVIYHAHFCDRFPDYSHYFASVSASWILVYRIDGGDGDDDDDNDVNDGGKRTGQKDVAVRLVQSFLDETLEDEDPAEKVKRDEAKEDEREDETWNANYACCWASKGDNVPVLLFAGRKGTIRGIRLEPPFQLAVMLLGHGGPVYDLKTHAVDDGIVFSASKDESIRMWNIRTSVCIAVFAGLYEGGHRQAVISMDCHPLGDLLATSGMDTAIRVWNLRTDEMLQAVRESDSHPRGPLGNTNPPALSIATPTFMTPQQHNNYVDGIKWVGDLLLSKSVRDDLKLWAVDSMRSEPSVVLVRKFHLPLNMTWFAQMDYFPPLDVLAVGNDYGSIFLYSLSALTETGGRGDEDGYSEDDDGDGDNDDDEINGNGPRGAHFSSNSSSNSTRRTVSPRDVACQPQHPRLELKPNSAMIRCLSFSSDGKYLLSSNDAATLCVWGLTATLPMDSL